MKIKGSFGVPRILSLHAFLRDKKIIGGNIYEKKFNTERLVVSAVLIALATVLSLFQPLRLPAGGGITILSMLPIVLISYRYGMAWGAASAFIFSLLQMLTGFDTVSALFLPGDNQQVWWRRCSSALSTMYLPTLLFALEDCSARTATRLWRSA